MHRISKVKGMLSIKHLAVCTAVCLSVQHTLDYVGVKVGSGTHI
jgi:hypothetical protein